MRCRARWLGLLMAGAAACGCSGPSNNVRFRASEVDLVWPGPPDVPRVRYLGEIRSSADVRGERSFGETMGDVLLGKEPPVGMVSPIGVCTDGGDRVFIADSNAQVVHVYDLSRNRYAQWTPPKGATPFEQPIALTWDPAGRLLVSDAGLRVVLAFDANGRLLGTLGENVLERPCGVAVQPGTGLIGVVDTGSHDVVLLDSTGALHRRIGGRGSDPGRFNFPTHIAFDAEGGMYISDSLNFRVQVFQPDGTFVRAIGRKGDIAGTFAQPKGIAIDPDGHVYVVDANFEAVQILDPDGTLLLAFGREGHGPGEFWLPNGAWFDRTGRLWIADSYNRRVQVFQYLSATGDEP